MGKTGITYRGTLNLESYSRWWVQYEPVFVQCLEQKSPRIGLYHISNIWILLKIFFLIYTFICLVLLVVDYLLCVFHAWLIVWSLLRWRHNEHDGVSNHQPHGCLLTRLFRHRSKKTSKLRVTGLCVGNSPGPVNSPHKGPVTRKMFPFDDVIMKGWTLWAWHPGRKRLPGKRRTLSLPSTG